MRATVMYRAGDVRIENVPDATIVHPTDAVIRITAPVFVGAISGLTMSWSPPRQAAAWAMRRSSSSMPSAAT
jgi:hypothetical protein